MTPVATLLCVLFILYLFRLDAKRSEGVSNAIWIPIIWMFFVGTRRLSDWLNLSATSGDRLDAYMEGSPVDRNVFFVLMLAGALVLLRRKVAWSSLLLRNKWIWLYFLFSLASVTWSDFPMLSLKRWFKALGNVIMALVILTERQPYVATGVAFRRLAFVTLPLSILFFRYFPDLGRYYHHGQQAFIGIALHKNGLGQLCLLAGLYFCWSLFHRSNDRVTLGGRLRVPVELVFVPLVFWMVKSADSATSLACTVLAAGLFAFSRVSWVAGAPGRLFTMTLVAAVGTSALELLFNVSDHVIIALDRDPTLTTRVPMWLDLLSVAEHPVRGSGYEIFWATAPGREMFERWNAHQAHNGYLETYLSLGMIGLFLMLAGIVSGLAKVRRELHVDYQAAVLRLAMIIVVVLYNWTEATLYSTNNMWLLLFLGLCDVPASAVVQPAGNEHRHPDLGGRPRRFGAERIVRPAAAPAGSRAHESSHPVHGRTMSALRPVSPKNDRA